MKLFVEHPADGCAALLPTQRRLRWLCYPLAVACELSALALRRPRLTPRENTRRCYERFFDPLCAQTGVWPDYTEGYYEGGATTYEEAKLAQFDFILDKTGAGPGVRVLDLGCGNGKLMLRATECGCECVGITVSSTQVEACRAQGLDVRLCSFDEVVTAFPRGSFDVVVLNGPSEHFVTQEDQLAGRAESIRRGLFEALEHLLVPGGRVFITCIHQRYGSDPHQAVRHPLVHRIGSYYFYGANLIGLYSGYYPWLGDYEEVAAQLDFSLALRRDATRDYYLTSQQWSRRLLAFVQNNPTFIRRFVVRLFLDDPRFFFHAFLYWVFDSWTWQFRGGDRSPMQHLWLMFEAPHRE